ncbi:Gfo/Idh/MocA family oxidoreductase [Nocardioides sp. LMS-CY]|uniref:Gfo/Idh/MocA family protein n=1 Tax=Nocardioides sp. (strain LMS-CY) TaxID=2840457 RepID=UPI001C00600D|nr:Gfo/Idh/MocA family oxidoreductase [Nocardioides sp. LMS-CY]QWF20533.1 Gfo/Idh/MocA family oxidoreductase [Nocardioides sp. LMS-CY]
MSPNAPFEPLRCAVVGLGSIGRDHAAILDALPETELVVGCDLDPTRRAVLPAEVPFVTEADAVLDRDDVDAVWVCTPQHLHRDLTVAALERGLHVFSEKPIAHSLADADAMIHAAERCSEAVLVVGHTLRFHPDFVVAMEAVAAGQVGVPIQLSARWNTGDHEGTVISGRTTVPLEMAIHDVDILRQIAGEVRSVFAVASTISPCGPGPDAVAGTLEFESGAVASLDHSWIMPSTTGMFSDHRLAVFGDRGTVYVETRPTPAQIFGPDGPAFPNTAYRQANPLIPGGALATADRHFVRTVKHGAPWPLTLADARAALAIALAMDRSIVERRPVEMREIEGER